MQIVVSSSSRRARRKLDRTGDRRYAPRRWWSCQRALRLARSVHTELFRSHGRLHLQPLDPSAKSTSIAQVTSITLVSLSRSSYPIPEALSSLARSRHLARAFRAHSSLHPCPRNPPVPRALIAPDASASSAGASVSLHYRSPLAPFVFVPPRVARPGARRRCLPWRRAAGRSCTHALGT